MSLIDAIQPLLGKISDVELRAVVQARLAVELGVGGYFALDEIGNIAAGKPLDFFSDISRVADPVLQMLDKSEHEIGKVVFQALIAGPTGINLDAVAPEDRAAIDTIQKVLGFAAELSLGTAAISAALEPLLGDHALTGALEKISRIPDRIGLPFFMGTVMADFFNTATGTPLRESIAQQTRPARLEWPQLSRLARLKALPEAELTLRLQRIGFRDEDIPTLLKLESQLLTVSDVQTLHEIGWFDDGTTRDYLDRLGLEPADRDAVMRMFAHKAATEGATSFRTIARNAFLDGYLSEESYRGLLTEAETPPEAIDLLVAGVQLERDAGRLHLTVAEIKDLLQHGHIDNNEARHRLGLLGLSDADAADMLLVWSDQQKSGRAGLTPAKVLAYLVGGVLSKKDAYDRLVAGGMKQADAQFLVDHPTTKSQVKQNPLRASTVVAAYKDDVLNIDEARKLLTDLKTDPTQLDLLLANATAVVTKGKKPKKPTRTISEAHILETLKYGLAESTWAERELETLGYSADDAMLLTMLELTKLDATAPAAYAWQKLT